MPTYDYECGACGHRFEAFQKITDDPLKKCPACRKLRLQRLIGTGAAIVFKGSGFYQTDYRSESYRKAAAGDKPQSDAPPPSSETNSAPSDAASTASTESKPSAKRSTKRKPSDD